MNRLLLALTCVLFLSSLSRGAGANGRFPRAQSILTPPGGDGSTLYLRATFGLLVSKDAGKSWRWTCEEAMGFTGTWDPPVAVTKDGRIWVGLENGLRVSTDGGCTFGDVPELKGQTVRDLTTDATGVEIVAVTSVPKQFTYVWRPDRSGKLQRLGPGADGVIALTIEVAPSRPSRVYMTAQSLAVPDARLFRSDDSGTILKELGVTYPTEPGEEPGRLFVSAVDPRDPDRVLLRRLTNKGSEILLSTDGGKTTKVALRMESAMFGFAKGPDGASYRAGSGVPDHGIFLSRDRGATWQSSSKTGVLCLLDTGKTVLACNNTGPGELFSASSDGKIFKTIAHLRDIEPMACPKSACEVAWPKVRAVLRPDPADGGPADLAQPDASPTASSTVAPIPSSSPSATPAARKGGCGCTLVGTSKSTDFQLSWGLVALAVGAMTTRSRDRGRSRVSKNGPLTSSNRRQRH